MQVEGSKGYEIKYEILKCQSYLLPHSNLSLEDQRLMFLLRTKMNNLPTNFSGSKCDPYCFTNCGQILNNKHLFECIQINKGQKCSLNYEKIYNGTLYEQIEVLNKMKLNILRRCENIAQRSNVI